MSLNINMLLKRADSLGFTIKEETELSALISEYNEAPDDFTPTGAEQTLLKQLSHSINQIEKGFLLNKLLHRATRIQNEADVEELKKAGIDTIISLSDRSQKDLADREMKLERLQDKNGRLFELSDEALVEKYYSFSNLNLNIGLSSFCVIMSMIAFSAVIYISRIEVAINTYTIFWIIFGSIMSFCISGYILVRQILAKIDFAANKEKKIKELSEKIRSSLTHKTETLRESNRNVKFQLEKQTYSLGAKQMQKNISSENEASIKELEPFFKRRTP